MKDYGSIHIASYKMGISEDDEYLFTADPNGIIKQWSLEKKIAIRTEVVLMPKDLADEADKGNNKIRFLCL